MALELSYVNSNLQLLKEELADLNSSVQIYQNDGWVFFFWPPAHVVDMSQVLSRQYPLVTSLVLSQWRVTPLSSTGVGQGGTPLTGQGVLPHSATFRPRTGYGADG